MTETLATMSTPQYLSNGLAGVEADRQAAKEAAALSYQHDQEYEQEGHERLAGKIITLASTQQSDLPAEPFMVTKFTLESRSPRDFPAPCIHAVRIAGGMPVDGSEFRIWYDKIMVITMIDEE